VLFGKLHDGCKFDGQKKVKLRDINHNEKSSLNPVTVVMPVTIVLDRRSLAATFESE